MNQTKFLKIFSYAAFAAFLFISCWATVESLHLLLPTWPVPIFWIATIGIFVLASLGSKLIVDSFNQYDFVDNKGWRLIGGIVMLLVFWVLFSLPTNTHTFFYKSVVKEVMQGELVFVKDKLGELQNGGEAKKMVELEKAEFTTKVNAAFDRVHSEIMDPNNVGYGPRAKETIRNLANILGNGVEFQEPKFVNSHQGRLNCSDNLRRQKDNFLAIKLAERDKKLEALFSTKKIQDEIADNIQKINKIQNALLVDADNFINPDNKEFKTAKGVLTNSLGIIKNYSDGFIKHYPTASPLLGSDYQQQQGKEIVKQDIISKTQKLESVIEVWQDFFNGKYAGRGFVFWIIIAALVDIAGFIFFDIAFKKSEY
jgi:hypothetical protein